MQRHAEIDRPSVPSRSNTDKSFLPSMIGCIGLVVVVAAVTFAGTASAVNALNRNATNQIALARQPQHVVVNDDSSTNDKNSSNTSKPSDTEKKASQLEWAQKYSIVWDEGGNPIDENGNIMNDPTTSANEVARAIARGDATAEGISIYWLGQQEAVESVETPVAPQAPAKMYEGVANVSQRSDGTYIYTVQRGDCLTRICGTIGVDMPTIMKLNQIDNPSLLEVGQQLVLPSGEVTHNQSGAGLG